MCPMAAQVMRAVARAALPFRLDTITQGDGNCLSRALVAQCQRPTVRRQLELRRRHPSTYSELKAWVVESMLEPQTEAMTDLRERFLEQQAGAVARGERSESWQHYCWRMGQEGEWGDAVFLQAAAWYLNHDIIVVPTGGSQDHMFFTISGNWRDERVPCRGVPLILGYVNNLHYQSLLPMDEGNRQEVQGVRSIEQILREQVKEAVRVFEEKKKSEEESTAADKFNLQPEEAKVKDEEEMNGVDGESGEKGNRKSAANERKGRKRKSKKMKTLQQRKGRINTRKKVKLH